MRGVGWGTRSLLSVFTWVLVGCASSAAPQAPARAARSAEAEALRALPADPPEAESRPVCSAVCSEQITRLTQSLGRLEGVSGTSAEPALAGAAAAQAVLAFQSCGLRQPEPADASCEGALRVVPEWIRTAQLAGLTDVELEARLVARDARWRTEEAPTDAARLRELMGATRSPSLALAAAVALGDTPLVLRYVSAASSRGEPGDVSAVLGAAGYLLDAGFPADAVSALPEKVSQTDFDIVRLGHWSLGLWHTKQRAAALQKAEELARRWASLDPAARRAALARQAPYPLVDREAVMGALGAAQYLRGEAQREQAERLSAPSMKGVRDARGMKQYVEGPFRDYLREKQGLLELATAEYRAIAELAPVPPPRWVVEGAARVGQLWAALADELTSLVPPAGAQVDADSLDSLKRAMSASAAPLLERARRSLEVCVEHGRRERVAPQVVARCQEALARP